jgi:hypothetical protein
MDSIADIVCDIGTNSLKLGCKFLKSISAGLPHL